MQQLHRRLIATALILFAGCKERSAKTAASTWTPEMSPWFQPPAQMAADYGTYRSPLKFYDDDPVESPADWKRRRTEIRERWEQITGHWPEVIENPTVEVIETKKRENFLQKRIRLEIAPRQTAEAYLLIPEGSGRHAAVFVPGVDVETSVGLGRSQRDFAYQLTKRGFVTLSLGAPGGNPRTPILSDAPCQPLWFLAYIGANCANALAHLPEVDPARIGIVGHAYGGKWAMFASCLCDRYACAAWSEAGIVFDEHRATTDYWSPWYLGMPLAPPRLHARRDLDDEPRLRATGYKALMDAHLNLTELHALMAPRPFLVSAGSNRRPGWLASSADDESRWQALNHSIAVNRFLSYENRVALTNRGGHEPTAQSNEQILHVSRVFPAGAVR